MPRPKGSKNKNKATAPVHTALTLEKLHNKMQSIEAEITEISESLKAKKLN